MLTGVTTPTSEDDVDNTHSCTEDIFVTNDDFERQGAPSNPLPLQERHSLEFLTIVIGATALAFNAGFINGCTIQFKNIAVSHVTGTSTHLGISAANNDWENVSLCLCLICCFIFGSALTGMYVPNSSFQLGFQYGPLFLIGSALLLVSCVVAKYYPQSYWYFYFAAMASGLQNALTSRYSGNIIRTTHMTGTATDIGLVLGRICQGEYHEYWKLLVLIPIFFAFICGGVVSVFAFQSLGYLALAINVVVFFGVGLSYSLFIGSKLHIPVWRAFFGMYENVEKSMKGTHSLAKETVIKSAKHMRMVAMRSGKNISRAAGKLRGSSYDDIDVPNPLHESA